MMISSHVAPVNMLYSSRIVRCSTVRLSAPYISMLDRVVNATHTHPFGDIASDDIYSLGSLRPVDLVCISLSDSREAKCRFSWSPQKAEPNGNMLELSDMRGLTVEAVTRPCIWCEVCLIQWKFFSGIMVFAWKAVWRPRVSSHIVHCWISVPWGLSIQTRTTWPPSGWTYCTELIVSFSVHLSTKKHEKHSQFNRQLLLCIKYPFEWI